MGEQLITKNISNLRKQKGITLQELAEMTGLTKGYLSKIERSEKAPPYSTVNRIAIALGVDHAWSSRLDQAIAAGQVKSGYHPRGFLYYHTDQGMTDFSNGLSNNLDNAISSSSTAPGSSSGSSGGSSGGGGGGGGGGGW